MPWKLRKDRSELVEEGFLPIIGKQYFSVYLWRNAEALSTNIDTDSLSVPEEISQFHTSDSETLGACCHSPLRIKIDRHGNEEVILRPKLGELHFVAGRWTPEIIAHECMHAVLGSARMIGPDLSEWEDPDTDAEERVCYRLGKTVGALHEWLAATEAE